MKNYFGFSLIIWASIIILSLIFTWNLIQIEISQINFGLIDKQFFLSIFIVLFNPFLIQNTWYLWLIVGFIGGLIIREPKDGLILSLFSISSFYLIFLIYQIQFNIFLGYSFIGLLLFMFISSLGGLLGGLIHQDDKKNIKHENNKTSFSFSSCPKCGRDFDSNPLICSYCGSEILKKEKEIKEK